MPQPALTIVPGRDFCDNLLRDKTNCTVGYVNSFVISPSLPWQHGTRQQGWYMSGTMRKQFLNLTIQFILSLSIRLVCCSNPQYVRPSLMRWQTKNVALTVTKTTARLTSPRELDGCELVRARRAARMPLKEKKALDRFTRHLTEISWVG